MSRHGANNRPNRLKVTDKRIGYLKSAFDLPDYPVDAISFILDCEAAASFDELTRSNHDDTLARHVKDAWPNVFRQARLIPAVEYIQANRARTLLMQAMARIMSEIDVYISPTLNERDLVTTNMTGHPAVVVPERG